MDFLFPHETPRKIQKGFMQQVYATIKNKSKLLVHAPTGIGKSAASLSPAITYVLKENKKKIIFFLTSRNTQHMIAVETLRKIKKKYGEQFVVVDLVGKKGMCNQSGVQLLTSGEFSEYCKDVREKGKCQFYNNLRTKNKLSVHTQQVLKKLKEESPLHVEEINSICFNADVCSYETACLMGKDAQVIIADYNYMLNPHIRAGLLKRINKDIKDCIVIFDEAHNVPQRSRDLLTVGLNSFILDYAAKETQNLGYGDIAKKILTIKDTLEAFVKNQMREKDEVLITKKDFFSLIEEIGNYEELCGNFGFVGEQVLETKRRSFTKSLSNFMESWLGPDDGFTRILTKDFDKKGKLRVSIKYRCLDPALMMKDLREEAHSLILMSGTLTPLDFYMDTLGLTEEDTMTMEYENPFPPENRLNVILPETTTKFKSRSTMMFKTIAKKCTSIANAVPGNVVIFFPSYSLRDQIYEFIRDLSDKTIFLEEAKYTKEQRSELLERYKEYKDVGALLLAVAGGSFAEGIDLPGDLLKGVVVVGLPLGRPDLETKELINYYDRRFGKGWDYGYVYPAIIKILQSAGRCIRSETDRGIVAFVDERYMWQSYRKCFPSELKMAVSKEPKDLVTSFFAMHNTNI